MIEYRTSQSLVDCYRAFPLVASLDTYYPDFANWYWNKVLPSALTGDSFLVLAEQHGEVVGAAITRKGSQSKLRCVRVMPQLRGRGVALHLIDHALRELNADKPELTVPEELIHDYSRMFVNRYNFELTKVDKGLYRRGKLEYQFNSHSDQRVTTAY